jgi:hypothetical protein
MASLFPSISYYFLAHLHRSNGLTDFMVEGSNNAFPPKEVPFGVTLKKFEFTGSITPKNCQKEGVVCGFPAKLGESIKTHISVKSRDIDTKFDL